jgi:hypothetical protein
MKDFLFSRVKQEVSIQDAPSCFGPRNFWPHSIPLVCSANSDAVWKVKRKVRCAIGNRRENFLTK